MNNANISKHTAEVARFNEYYIGKGYGFARIYMADVGGLDVPDSHALFAAVLAIDSYDAADAFFDAHVAVRLG